MKAIAAAIMHIHCTVYFWMPKDPLVKSGLTLERSDKADGSCSSAEMSEVA